MSSRKSIPTILVTPNELKLDNSHLSLRPELLDMRRTQTRTFRGKLDMMAGKARKAGSVPRDTRMAGPTHSEDGVDLTLIRWMLSLTPAERLQVLQNNVRSILRLRGE